jgi:hypothetical protein
MGVPTAIKDVGGRDKPAMTMKSARFHHEI